MLVDDAFGAALKIPGLSFFFRVQGLGLAFGAFFEGRNGAGGWEDFGFGGSEVAGLTRLGSGSPDQPLSKLGFFSASSSGFWRCGGSTW